MQRVNRHNHSLNAALLARLCSLETDLTHIADRGWKKARIAAERYEWEAEGHGLLEDFEL